jgi:hypothetical protein
MIVVGEQMDGRYPTKSEAPPGTEVPGSVKESRLKPAGLILRIARFIGLPFTQPRA